MIRFVRGISQRQLAAQAGVTKRTITYLECGHHSPRIETAIAIGRALDLDDPRVIFPELFDLFKKIETSGYEQDASQARQDGGDGARAG